MADIAESLGEGVSEKLRRAHMHRHDFDGRVERFVKGNAYSVVSYDDVEGGRRLWKVEVHERPPLAEWGALIGDCLFNFRSALDHFAYDLAVAYSGFPLAQKVEEGSAFPIFTTRPPRVDELDKKIGAVNPEARNLIETMQPYGRKNRAALGYLETLQNFDKHRTLHLVVGSAIGISYMGEQPFDRVNFSPFEQGDEVASGPITNDPERDQDPHVHFGVAFTNDGPGRGYEVSLMLHWIGQHVQHDVIDPLIPFL